MEVFIRDVIKTSLKSVSSKASKGGIDSILKGRNKCRGGLCFGLEMSQVEETAIKMMLNFDTIRWLEVREGHKSYCN